MDSAQNKQVRHEAQQRAFAKYEKALADSLHMSDEDANAHVAAARKEWEEAESTTRWNNTWTGPAPTTYPPPSEMLAQLDELYHKEDR